MGEQFQVGEIAIVCAPGTDRHGIEVEIAGGEYRSSRYDTVGYDVDVPNEIPWDGSPHWFCETKYLRKKKPPPREIDKVISWDDDNSVWKPKVLEVTTV